MEPDAIRSQNDEGEASASGYRLLTPLPLTVNTSWSIQMSNAPLTVLSEDEQLFRESCRSFAEDRIKPLVRKMDEEAKLEQSVIPELFDLGLMGIHVPERIRRRGGSFFMSVLAVEEISRVDASFGVFIDVQNTLVNNAIMRWASDEPRSGSIFRGWPRTLVGAYALSEAGSGSDAFALACRAVGQGRSLSC